MTTPILTLDRLSRRYGEIQAVDGISLEIKKGEFISFLGPSGSGKTTTLAMIAGLTEPSSGRVILSGQDVTDTPPYRRNLGMVFQSYALFPHMTVQQNLAFPLEMRRLRKGEIANRVKEALDLVGLPGVAARYPKQLSGGQQQRVALARALIFQPPVLLMDEPLGALDKKLRMHMQLEIKRLHREISTTILYVTHDQEEALTMSDRVAVFNHGRLEQVGSPSALYEQPCSEFIADFVGLTTLLRGRIVEAKGEICKVDLGPQIVCARARQGSAPGDAVTISLRPERIRIVLVSALVNATFGGRVLEIIYLGGLRQILVRVKDGLDVLVVEQITTSDSTPPSIGDLVSLQWNPNDAVVLKS